MLGRHVKQFAAVEVCVAHVMCTVSGADIGYGAMHGPVPTWDTIRCYAVSSPKVLGTVYY